MDRVPHLLARVARQRTAALMGIVNATPDSFYDGGRYERLEAIATRVAQLLADGADIVDVGGESSRPGAAAVPAREQIERIGPAVRCALERGALVSVDTASAEVADFALERGAHIVNDVTCLEDDELAGAVARRGGYLILSHSRGHQSHMPGFSSWPDDAYTDVVAEVLSDLNAARERAVKQGVARDQIVFDPGLGFSKNARHCVELLARCRELVAEGTVWLFGTGRKSFIASVDGSPAEARLGGTIAASLYASRAGVQILRVHDVFPLRQALAIDHAIDLAHASPLPTKAAAPEE